MKSAHIYADRKPETFSVPERCVVLGFEVIGPEAHSFVTAAGHRVRDAWIAKHQVRPDTELTRKSSGKGTHHKARYPLSFQDVADSIIRETAESEDAAQASQLLFCFDPPEPKPDLVLTTADPQPELIPRTHRCTQVLTDVDPGGMSLGEARRIVDAALVRREKTKCLCCGLALKVQVVKLCEAVLDLASGVVRRARQSGHPVLLGNYGPREPACAWGLIKQSGQRKESGKTYSTYSEGPAYAAFMDNECVLPAALYYFDDRLVGVSAANAMVWQITGEEP